MNKFARCSRSIICLGVEVIVHSNLETFFFVLLCLLGLTVVSCGSSLATCKCVHFTSGGVFHSPNYPYSKLYHNCLLYKFIAPANHIIIATFEVFELSHRSERVYDDTSDGFINERTPYNGEYCGKEIEPGKAFTSLSDHLLFHISLIGVTKGFKGTYRFVSKDEFRSTATEVGECQYNVEELEGNIFSPRFPYYYPSFTHCAYSFPFRRSLSLFLSLELLDLPSVSCDSDYIDVYQLDPKVHLDKLCYDTIPPYNLTSRRGLLLEFYSDVNQGSRSRGFQFSFKYVVFEERPEERLANTAVQQSSSIACPADIWSPSILSNSNSVQQATGTINSTWFIHKGDSLTCKVAFKGSAEEQVQITFLYFNLHPARIANENQTERCRDADSVSIYVRIGMGLSHIGDFCGNQLPPRIMSSKNYLELVYNVHSTKALQQSDRSYLIGFTLQYEFRTDLGLGDLNGERDSAKACHFLFRSSRHKAGSIYSPNYPGLYPRMVNCQYTFRGSANEIVVITFEYFDVEGLIACDDASSDYVLFSNYQILDRTNWKYCGKTKPTRPIQSESGYFRVLFRSNAMFDGRGFYANYQFVPAQAAEPVSLKIPNGASWAAFDCIVYVLWNLIVFTMFCC